MEWARRMWLRLVLLGFVGTIIWMELEKNLAYPLIYYLCVPDLIFLCSPVWCVIECTVRDFVDEVICHCVWQHDLGCKGGLESFKQWDIHTFPLGEGLALVALHFAAAQIFWFPSKRYYHLFSFIVTPLGRGARAYTFRFGLHFCTCGRASCTKKTYFFMYWNCPFRCVRRSIWRGR